MSTFAVTKEIVETVTPAPKSDRLDVITLEDLDFQLVTQRGLYQPGDVVVYFPVDSLIPDWVQEALGITGYLANGSTDELGNRKQDRVKTIKLRGNLSQGMCCKPETLLEAVPHLAPEFGAEDLAPVLGVTKYELPAVPDKAGNLIQMPDLVYVYDIEGCERYRHVLNLLMDKKVYITEKVEGSHWWCHIDKEGQCHVGQRRYEIEPIENGEHNWWRAYRLGEFEAVLRKIQQQYNGAIVTIRGEIVGPGIQGNYYEYSDFTVYAFDIEISGIPVSPPVFYSLAVRYGITVAPLLAQGELSKLLDGQTPAEASTGNSRLVDRLREGIVIKPAVEQYRPDIGRVFLKQRSPEYLLKTEA